MDYETKHRLWGHYEAIQICKELCEQHGYDVNEICGDKILKRKRKIREIYKRENEKPERHVVLDNGIDGYIELIQLPEKIKEKEDADEWFLCNEYLEYIPSAYDCTGQKFTDWYKLVNRNGRWWVYHSILVDV